MANRTDHWRQCLLSIIVTWLGLIASSHAEERSPGPATTATRMQSRVEDPALVVVRARRAGTIMAVWVKPGDRVAKDQALGHTDLDTAKFNRDLARAHLEATGTLDQMFWQYQAFIVTREETEKAVRKRTMEKSRLEFAKSMENWAKGQYQAQQDNKRVQKIQFEYHQKEYESRFMHSPVTGVIADVKAFVGQAVAVGAPVFSIVPGDGLTSPAAATAIFDPGGKPPVIVE